MCKHQTLFDVKTSNRYTYSVVNMVWCKYSIYVYDKGEHNTHRRLTFTYNSWRIKKNSLGNCGFGDI